MAIVKPSVGLVVRYEYLWSDEKNRGQDNGRKARPVAIVLIKNDQTVIVVPITHSKPHNLAYAVEIPLKTKRRLGLDNEPAWAICCEVNEFIWPGPDLRPVQKLDVVEYGFLPPDLYEKIKHKVLRLAQGRQLKLVVRND